jgi:hypothetical protein
MKFITKTQKKIARNPVARAIAKNRLKKAITDHRIGCFLLENGENCFSEATAMSQAIFVMLFSYEELNQTDSVEYRKLKSAGVVLTDCAQKGWKWNKEWAITLDNAMEICQENWTKIPPKTLQASMEKMEQIQ